MAFSDIDRELAKEQIRSRLDIVEVVGRYVNLRPAGQNMKAICPFHKEKTPSFIVNPSRQIFHCFGCGKGGDVFTFIMDYEQLSFGEVIRRLAEETGVRLGPAPRETVEAARPGISKNTLLRIHEIAAAYYYAQMKGSATAIEYFKKRGLSSRTVQEFRIGYAPPGWENLVSFAATKKVSSPALAACGLAIARSDGTAYDRFRDRIMFPIYDISGRPIAFGGRALSADAEAKYMNSPETALYHKARTLYGLHKSRASIKESGYAIVVEGYMDFLSLYQDGIRNSVATSGTSLTVEHGRIVRRFTPRVVLLFDGDAAGVGAAERAVFTLAPLGLDVRVLILSAEEDPDSYIKTHGASALLGHIEKAPNGIDFAIQHAVQTYALDTPQGKSAVVNHMAPLVAATSDPIVASEYVKQIAESSQVREQFVLAAVRKARTAGAREAGELSAPPEKFLSSVEGSVLALMVHHPQLIEIAMERVEAKTFTDSFSMNLYSLIVDTYRHDTTLQTLVSRVEEGEAKRVLSRILVQPWPVEDPELELRYGLGRLEAKALKAQMRSISSKLKNEHNDQQKNRLLEEQNRIAQSLRELETRW